MIQSCPTFWTPSTLFSILTAIVTITGWIITAKLSRSNSLLMSKKSEINRLVDELYKNLDGIYEEMLLIMLKKTDPNVVYHKFIAIVRNVNFTCQRIHDLDESQLVNSALLGELRQACTDDRKYIDSRITTTLAELQDIHERIKMSFIKKF